MQILEGMQFLEGMGCLEGFLGALVNQSPTVLEENIFQKALKGD